jgi:hypothetical protein
VNKFHERDLLSEHTISPMNRRIFLSASVATLAGIALQNSLEAQSVPAAQNAELRAKADGAIEKGLGFLEKAQKPGGFWSTPDYPGLTGLIVQAFATAPGGKPSHIQTSRRGAEIHSRQCEARWRDL